MSQVFSTKKNARLPGVTVRATGARGRASVTPARSTRLRADVAGTPLDDRLEELGLEEKVTVELDDLEVSAPGPAARKTRGGATAVDVEIEVETIAGDEEAVLLVQDGAGALTWQFPEGPPAPAGSLRSSTSRVFRIELSEQEQDNESSGRRGLVGAVLKRVVKVLTFKVAGAVAERGFQWWEAKKRPHRLRSVTLDDYKLPGAPDLDAGWWASPAAEGPVLLLVHGTNSRTHEAFKSMAPEVLRQLHQMYGGRVVAFDHPTVSIDPRRNVEVLMDLLPDGRRHEVDVVCHSRGGLVARWIAENDNPKLDVRKIVFVATPNNGTPLADPEHLKDFLDSYTNLLSLVPDNPFTTTLETVVELVKSFALSALGSLDGLRSMDPDGDFLSKTLNGAGLTTSATYSAIAADFEPGGALDSVAVRVRDMLTDKVFSPLQNDLVVPTESAFEANGSSLFPIGMENVMRFDSAATLHHSGFFGDDAAMDYVIGRLAR